MMSNLFQFRESSNSISAFIQTFINYSNNLYCLKDPKLNHDKA